MNQKESFMDRITSQQSQMEDMIETESLPQSEDDTVHIANPLGLTWTFGLNRHVPVLNMCRESEKLVFYVTSNAGVIFDWKNNRQVLLQGHCNAITCCCVSCDKRWLVTADTGKDSTVIVWDAYQGVPIRTLFDVSESGVKVVALSHDAKYLATMSFVIPQILSIWDWTTERESPLCHIALENQHGLQTCLSFHPTNPHHLVSNNKNNVIFFYWQDDQLDMHAPPLTDKDFNKVVGNYSQSIFQCGTEYALTSTSCGNIVVWTKGGGTKHCDRKAFKIIRLQESSITVLVQHQMSIVTGDTAGSIKFFDQNLKMVNWYSQLEGTGSINSFSFSFKTQKDVNKLKSQSKKNYPVSSTLGAEPFVAMDFMIGTLKANVMHFRAKGSRVTYVKQEHAQDVTTIACHPTESRICIGSHGGLLQLWDFDKRILLSSRQFSPGEEITSLEFDPLGSTLATGYSDGRISFLDALSLTNEGSKEQPSIFHHCHDEITKMVFSFDSLFLASADLDRCVSLFKANVGMKDKPWSYVGKHRAHYKRIVDLCFGKVLDELKPRLLSLGEDRILAEYDVQNSTEDNLILLGTDRIEQSAIPMSFTWYPPIVKEEFLVVSNNQFKLKLLNSTTKMCRKTVLGPTYGSPIQRLHVLPRGETESHPLMAYCTSDKVGLLMLPLDGNPHKSMAVIAHPGKVYALATSHDGQYIFTAGGADYSVLMWKVDGRALEATAKLGGEGLIPFYGLLEGGEEGELYAELEDYFYYAQIRSQSVDSCGTRDVSAKIPLDEVPFLMRALGHYPTEQEIDDMINEVKFSTYVETGKYVTDIDLGEFIKLFVNHRPAFGLSFEALSSAFDTLGYQNVDGESAIERQTLLDMLQSKGEHLTETELAEYLSTLLGLEDTDDNSEKTNSADLLKERLSEQLPEETTANLFASELLGLEGGSG